MLLHRYFLLYIFVIDTRLSAPLWKFADTTLDCHMLGANCKMQNKEFLIHPHLVFDLGDGLGSSF